tara:strand:- start:12900 stop:15683 length:2784 start_codon:yes stop_codon:yes gene_type:complete
MASDNKIFVSPGVFTSEKDLSFVAQQVGVTTLGVVGETTKGPAFEPIFITNYDEFTSIFGGQNPSLFGNEKPKYELPYIARNYLSQSNQLFVTRILGLTGYDAGQAWMVTTEANYDPSTITSGSTLAWTATFTGTTYGDFAGAGVGNITYLNSLGLLPSPSPSLTSTVIPNDTATYPEGIVFDKTGASFSGESSTFIQNTYDLTALTGTCSGTVTTYIASAYTQYEGMVVAMLRSRADYSSDDLVWRTQQVSGGLVMNPGSVGTDPLADFELSATSNTTSAVTKYDVSMDVSKRNYITRVLGTDCFDSDTMVFAEEHYPKLLSNLIANNYISGLDVSLAYSDEFENYKQQWQTPETPWVVSELRGNIVEKLFKIISISDGSAANKEIKISIANIKPDTKEFDIVVRSFSDLDARPSILESFRKCVMDPESDNYVARRVGTADGEFSLRSRYIMLVVNPVASIDSFTAGFEGYIVRDYDTGVLAPETIYKTAYNPTVEKIRKVYLGISNTVGIDQNMFNWKGYTDDATPRQWTATTKGFHMDSGATIAGDFEVGVYQFRSDAGIQGTDYEGIRARKFTFVPYLGFDGWNCYRDVRTNGDRYKVGKTGWANGLTNGEFILVDTTEGTSDYYAYQQGFRTFANPEAVNVNVLTVSNVEFGDNNELVSEVIDMVEEERADSVYILSAPEGATYDDTGILTGLGFNSAITDSAEDIVDLLDVADIDSNYTATYWPWIQSRDQENNVNVWLPPTYEVVRNIALTDNVSFPWFASAGYTRGLTNALQARVKLTEDQRDTLYEGRINPMATFSDQGVVIWGNKNLQIADSALDRLNIRRLLLQTRKLISAVAVRLLFEQNDQIVRNQFLSLVNPILENIKRERGLADFRVQLSSDPEEIDRNELRGKIFLKPVPSLEFIILEFNVTSTGASFDDI